MALEKGKMRSTMAPSPVLEFERLIRKAVLLLLLVSAYALSMVLFLVVRPWYWQALRWVFTVILLGLIAGFSTRLLFHRRNGIIQSLCAISSFIAGMLICGYASEAQIGFDIAQLLEGNIRWLDLGGLVTGIVISMAALWAWHHPAPRATKPVSVSRPVISNSTKTKTIRQTSRVRRPVTHRVEPMPSMETISISKPLIAERPVVHRKPKRDIGKTLRLKSKGLLRHKNKVQLAVVEEHRCPYCLEPVSRNDPRGVVECDICHSLHHKDCWDITGTCQVPHLNQ